MSESDRAPSTIGFQLPLIWSCVGFVKSPPAPAVAEIIILPFPFNSPPMAVLSFPVFVQERLEATIDFVPRSTFLVAPVYGTKFVASTVTDGSSIRALVVSS